MKNAFLTELNFTGKVPANYNNLRTEYVWMIAAQADHYNIWDYSSVVDYDQVFVIIPKGSFNLNVVGATVSNAPNHISPLLSQPFIQTLQLNNRDVWVIQEGPAWLQQDWSPVDIINWVNEVWWASGILAHNESDVPYWRGIFPHLKVRTIPTMMMVDGLEEQTTPFWKREKKTIVGGNFSRWYGGFPSYLVARYFESDEIWIPTSHSRREGEESLPGVKHLPRMMWGEWMANLKEFMWGVHLMPTRAAGTFNLNCAWLGIPTIGNVGVDTQRICFPTLSVDPDDVEGAVLLAEKLVSDPAFAQWCSEWAQQACTKFIYYPEDGMHPLFLDIDNFDLNNNNT